MRPIKPAVFLAAAALALSTGGCGRDQVAEKTTVPPAPERPAESAIAYAIQIQGSNEAATDPAFVGEDRKFASGDRLRFVFRPEFDAHLYLVNRGPRQSVYQVLFPSERIALHNPIPSGQKLSIPDASGWLRLDAEPGDENLILVASTAAIPEFDGLGPTVDRDDYESRLAQVERRSRPRSSRRFEDGDWVKLFAARGKENLAIVLRIPLLHE